MLIGGLELKNNLCLAPLAGITTLPVREFFSDLGAALTHTEMISCAGLNHDNAKTFDMLKTSEFEAPLVVQLFANDEKILLSGAECVLRECKRFSAFGINMACPMPKITKNGSGSALLKKTETAFNMVKSLKTLNLPVWVKIRKLENDFDTLKFVETVLNAGADNVCIHGRTQAQRYEGFADKNIVGECTKNFPGFISASGDVKTLNDIQEYLLMGCVSVMLARGALFNPFLFSSTPLERGDSLQWKYQKLINFAKRAEILLGEHKAVVLLKKFVPGILRNTHGSAEKRNLACSAVKLNDIIEILKGEFINNYEI